MEKLVIYRIVNTKTGLSYIGQTRRGFAVRKRQHLSRLSAAAEDNRLYRAMREYGEDAFEFEVICHAMAPEFLDDLERYFIAEFDTFANGYNSTDGGATLAPEAIAKISRALKGRDAHWARSNWDRRRANGTDKIDMRKHVPAGAESVRAKSYVVQDPNGRLFAITGLKAFCREHGLTFKAMYDTLNGVQTHHKGYVLLKAMRSLQNIASSKTSYPLCVAQGYGMHHVGGGEA